jgi:hypothetical protein
MTEPEPEPPAYLKPEGVFEDVVTAVVGTFEAAGVAIPARRVWGVETVAADCEQLSFVYSQQYKGLPADDPNQAQQCESPRSMVLVVQLWRCSPQPKDPRIGVTPAQRETFTRTILRDGWLLLDAASQVDAVGWNRGIIADVTVSEPSDLVASILNLTIPI